MTARPLRNVQTAHPVSRLILARQEIDKAVHKWQSGNGASIEAQKVAIVNLKSLNVVIRASDICNQNCLYCYVSEGARKGGPRIALPRLERFFRSILSGVIFTHVNIVWHGGEPTLLGTEYLSNAIRLASGVKAPHVTIEHAIQTNASALSDSMVNLFLREKVIVGISMDAPPEVHDRFRVSWSGRPTLKRVMAGADKLRKAGIPFGAICVLHSGNYHRAQEIYAFFKEQRLSYQLNPFYGAEAVTGEATKTLAITPEQYAEALVETFDMYINDAEHTIDVKDIRDILTSMMTGASTNCLFRGACDEFVGVTTDGNVYVCDNFGLPDALIASIDTVTGRDIIQSKAIRFIKERPAVLQSGFCKGCRWWAICRGGCSSKARAVFGSQHREDPFCESRKVLFGRMASFVNTLQKEEP